VGYFISCSVYKDEQLLRATDRVIAASKRRIQQFGGADICCGAPLYYMGDNEGFKEVARKMKGEIEKRGLKRLVVACPNCIKMMRDVYPGVGVGLGVEIVHTVEYLAALLNQRRIAVKKGKGSATYHDPCVLVNDLGIVAPPRSILRALGYEIREPVYSKEDTHCCGGLSGARVGFTGLVDKVKSMRTRELKQTTADVYVSACPTCKAVLSEVGLKDLTELVAEHVADG
jgi:Fe-S oxidoreductase